jgi:alpha-methylacyl-CoA racemase
VGAIEPQFHAELVRLTGLDFPAEANHLDPSVWPDARARLAQIFKTRTREEWRVVLEGSDACFAPVLGLGEAPAHDHNRGRQAFLELDGVVQPAPAPRFSRTPAAAPAPPAEPGAAPAADLEAWGFSGAEVEAMKASGLIA